MKKHGAARMTDLSLDDLAARVLAKRRIGKYDVEAMQRTVLKSGLGSRAEAELLISLDRTVGSVHFSWPRYFASILTEFVVWNSGPSGYIDAEKAAWLLPLLAGEGATSRATRALVTIAEEAECFDEAFFAGSKPPVLVESRAIAGSPEFAQAA
jgi:hypothetical protein